MRWENGDVPFCINCSLNTSALVIRSCLNRLNQPLQTTQQARQVITTEFISNIKHILVLVRLPHTHRFLDQTSLPAPYTSWTHTDPTRRKRKIKCRVAQNIPEGATGGGSGRICPGAPQLDVMLTDIYNPTSLTKFLLTILIGSTTTMPIVCDGMPIENT
jgi:hypothetical protein